jgi:hypothetical protein
MHVALLHNLTISFWRGIMKKQLLTTTALVAAVAFAGSAMAGKPKLTVAGDNRQIIGVGENDSAFDAANGARVGLDQHSDAEVHFKGSVTLDNGIKIATSVQLEGNTEETDYIDENYMRISGGFGMVTLGSHDLAGQAMTTGYLGAWSTNVGLNVAFDTTDWVTRPDGKTSHFAGTVNRVDISSDAEGISYFTPRVSGFQAGISYMPAAREDANKARELKTVDTDGISLGVNFVKKMGGIGVGVAAGYATANEVTAGLDDPELYAVGLRLDFQGFRVGLSSMEAEDQGTATNTTAHGTKTFEAGVRYTMGANMISATYVHTETTSRLAARDDDETETMWLGYQRTLGPGVVWTVNAIFADFEDGAANPGAAAENDGQALVTSIGVRF